MSVHRFPVALFILLFSLAPILAHGQDYRIGSIPGWVVQHSMAEGHISDTACISGGMEYLLVDRQYDLATQAVYYRQVVRLTSADAVQQGSRFSASFDPSYQQITLHALQVIRNNKVIDHLVPARIHSFQQERDMAAFLYDGSITVVSDLHDVRVGDLVEFAYTTTGWDASGDGRFHRRLNMAHSMPVGFSHTRFIVPEGRTLRFRMIGGVAPGSTRSTGGITEHIWESKDLPCVTVDDGTPGWFERYPSLEVTEYTSFDQLREWGTRLFQVDLKPQGELAERISILKAVPELAARMDSAVALVQREVRYLGFEHGIGAYRPHPPDMVFNQRYGDCKDKSLLLVSVLRACGIRAAPALVNSVSGLSLNDQLPRPSLFDHCIVRAELDGKAHWLDPTMSHNGGNADQRYVPDFGYALVLGDEVTGKLERMQVNNSGTLQIKERFLLTEVGSSAELTVVAKYAGRFADAQRNTFANSSLSDLERRYAEYYSAIYGPCDVLSPLSASYDAEKNLFTTREHYRIPKAWDTLANGQTLRFSILASGIRDYMSRPGAPRRNAPLALGQPLEVKHRIEVVLPEPWNVEPGTHRRDGFGAHYLRTIDHVGNTAIFSAEYRQEADHVTETDYPAFFAQQNEVGEDLAFEFTWNTAAAGTSPRRSLSWVLLLLLCAGAIVGALALYRHDPAPALPVSAGIHREIGGFLLLPAIGLCLGPFIRFYQLLDDGGAMIHAPITLWAAFPDHQWSMFAYGLLTLAYNLGMLTFMVVLAFLFFKRRSSVPVLFKVFYSAMVIGLALDALAYSALGFEQLSGEPYPMKDLVQGVIAAAIWMPVFHYSDRVKRTFVVRRTPAEGLPVPAMPVMMDHAGAELQETVAPSGATPSD